MEFWVIYHKPKDLPMFKYVARVHTLDGPGETVIAASLQNLRETFKKKGLIKMTRFESDDPVIVEVWF